MRHGIPRRDWVFDWIIFGTGIVVGLWIAVAYISVVQ